MATRKTPQKRRTTTSRKKTSTRVVVGKNITILLATLLGILGLFKLGLLGVYVADAGRFVFGNLYWVALLPLTVSLGYYFIFKKWIKVAHHFVIGLVMAFVALLTLSSLLFFTYDIKNSNGFASEILRLIAQDVANKSANTPVGGGVAGALLYQVSFTLLSNIGTWIISLILFFGGVVIFFRIPARDLTQKGFEKAQEGVAYVQSQRENRPEKRQSLFRKKPKKDTVSYTHLTLPTTERV